MELERQALIDAIQRKQAVARKNTPAFTPPTLKSKNSNNPNLEFDLEEQIAEMEFEFQISSLTPKEERHYLLALNDLKAKRDAVKKAAAASAAAPKSTGTAAAAATSAPLASENPFLDVAALKKELDDVKKRLDTARDARKAVHDRLRKVIDDRKSAAPDLTSLFAERDEMRKELADLIEKRNTTRDELYKKIKQWAAEDFAKRQKNREAITQQRAEDQFQREVRALERKLEDEDDTPFSAEVLELRQTITYLQSFVREVAAKEAAANNANATPTDSLKDAQAHLAESGLKGTLVLPKSMREPVIRGKRGARNTQSTTAPANAAAPVLRHDLTSLALFAKLNLAPPTKVEHCQDAIDAIQKELQGIVAKQDAVMASSEARKQTIRDELDKIKQRGPVVPVYDTATVYASKESN